MPTRIIRDGVLDSERYNALPTDARLAFFELLLVADDYGLLHLSQLWLRRRCPVFEGKGQQFVEAVLSALADQDMLRIYEVKGVRYGYIPRFGNRPQALKPKFPVPPERLGGDEVARAMLTAKNRRRQNNVIATIEPGASEVQTQSESPETETETETETEMHFRARSKAGTADVVSLNSRLGNAENDFAECWALYPKREGGNSRQEALKAYTARRREGIAAAILLEGVKRYRAFCDSKGVTRTSFVKQTKSFFGPGRHFEESWEITELSPAQGREVARVAASDPTLGYR